MYDSIEEFRASRPKAVDIGSDHFLTPFVLSGDPKDAKPAGWEVWHWHDRDYVGGGISVRRFPGEDGPTWTVESWDPLTVSPSVLCRDCGDHGFIQEGRWVPT